MDGLDGCKGVGVMSENKKDCNGCRWAKWAKAPSGRLSPTGDGMCSYPIKPLIIPGAFYWVGSGQTGLYGGYINRREELKADCPTRDAK